MNDGRILTGLALLGLTVASVVKTHGSRGLQREQSGQRVMTGSRGLVRRGRQIAPPDAMRDLVLFDRGEIVGTAGGVGMENNTTRYQLVWMPPGDKKANGWYLVFGLANQDVWDVKGNLVSEKGKPVCTDDWYAEHPKTFRADKKRFKSISPHDLPLDLQGWFSDLLASRSTASWPMDQNTESP